MKKVFICSPYRGDVGANKMRALIYCRRAVDAGYTPYAPHLYFPQFLDDDSPDERKAGMDAGLEWLRECDEIWVFGAPSAGMRVEIAEAERIGIKVVRRDRDGVPFN